MSFFSAVPGIHKTWVRGWEWWAERKARTEKEKGKEPDLELGALRPVTRAQQKEVEDSVANLTESLKS